MKNLYILTIMLCIGLMSCNSNRTDEDVQTGVQNPQVVCCGVENPQNNLPWLKDLIKKANSDETLQYRGTIWLENYKGEDIIVTDMIMGDFGLYYHIFDCSGKYLFLKIETEELNTFSANMKLNVVIYSNYSKF